jgi:hypothetical protein
MISPITFLTPRKDFFALSVLSLALAAGTTHAAIFLNETFDGYADQAAFQAAWTPVAATELLTTEQFTSAGQAVKGLTTAARNQRSVGEIGALTGSSDKIIFRFNYYDSAGAASAYRQFAELDDSSAPGASGQLFAMGLNNSIASTFYMARVLGFDGGNGSGAFFKLDGIGAPTRTTGWHSLEADIYDNEVKFFVDSILSKDIDTTALTDRSLDFVKIGSNVSSTQVAYYDDVYVERTVVPEPTSMGLGLLAGLVFLGAKRRR